MSNLTHITEGWDHYPLNVAAIFPAEDLQYLHDQLAENTARLFNNDRLRLKICSRSTVRQNVVTHDIIEPQSFKTTFPDHLSEDEDHIITLHQSHSWAPFECSAEIFLKILTAYRVHPFFLDFLQSFGEKHREKDEDMFGGYASHLEETCETNSGNTWSNKSFHTCYAFRYVDRTGRPNYPWAIRRTGVYHKYNARTGHSVWILLQPTPEIERIIKVDSINPFGISKHILLMSSAMRKWRGYLKDLDESIKDKSQIARFFNSSNFDSKKIDFPLAFSDVQRLQYDRERLQDAVLHLKGNIEIVLGLENMLSALTGGKESPLNESTIAIGHNMKLCVSRFCIFQSWAQRSLDIATSTSGLIQTVLGYRHDEFLSRNSDSVRRMTEFARKDSQTMLTLSHATKKDSTTMKLIAVISMAYLPATFVATLFSTNFLSLSLDATSHSIAAKLGGVYTIVTTILMAFTLFGAYLWNLREEKSRSVTGDSSFSDLSFQG